MPAGSSRTRLAANTSTCTPKRAPSDDSHLGHGLRRLPAGRDGHCRRHQGRDTYCARNARREPGHRSILRGEGCARPDLTDGPIIVSGSTAEDTGTRSPTFPLHELVDGDIDKVRF